MIATPAEHEAELLRAAAEIELARIREHVARQAVLAAANAPAGYSQDSPKVENSPAQSAAVDNSTPAARQAVLAAANAHQGRHCPHCGQPIVVADTPAGARDWPPRSGWRERGSLL